MCVCVCGLYLNTVRVFRCTHYAGICVCVCVCVCVCERERDAHIVQGFGTSIEIILLEIGSTTCYMNSCTVFKIETPVRVDSAATANDQWA